MKKYALLIGINQYKLPAIPELYGCENDVENMAAELSDSFEIQKITGEAASRDNIIAQFRTHLGQAEKGDLAVFYFSGHGALETSPSSFLDYQQDEKHESIVCWDSYTQAGTGAIYGLADKETKLLIKELTDKRVEVVVIYDCCHSGSGVRNIAGGNTREVILDEEINRKNEADFLAGTIGILNEELSGVLFLAACKPRQRAKERAFTLQPFRIEQQGIFTYSLLQVLKKTNRTISYADLANYCYYFVQRIAPTDDQIPEMEVFGNFDTGKIFLSNQNDSTRLHASMIIFNKHKNRWQVPIGAIHGLKNEVGKIPKFKIFSDQLLQEEVCFAEATAVNIAESTLVDSEAENKGETLMPNLNKSKNYYALPTYLPLEKLLVYVSWSEEIMGQNSPAELLERLKKEQLSALEEETYLPCNYAIEWTVEEDLRSLYELQIAKAGGHETYKIVHKETKLSLLRENQEIPSLEVSAKLLLHIAKWTRVLNMKNYQSAIDTEIQNEVKIRLKNNRNYHVFESNEITLDYVDKIPLQLFVENKTEANTWQLMTINVSRKIKTAQMTTPNLSPDKKEVLWNGYTGIPALDLQNKSLNQATDTFKFLLSKEAFFYGNLALSRTLVEEFDHLMVRAKSIGRSSDRTVDYEKQWFVKTMNIKVLRTLNQLKNQVLSIANGRLRFQPHPYFRADVSLTSSADYVRGPLTDRWIKLKMEALGFDLIDFSENGKKETVLEIHHIENEESLRHSQLILDLKIINLQNRKIAAVTLPPNFLEKHIGTLQFLGYLTAQGNDFYRLQLSSIPTNPSDGRAISSKSLKISFVLLNEGQQKKMEKIQILDRVGAIWLDLEQIGE